jgi:hypothetical protein
MSLWPIRADSNHWTDDDGGDAAPERIHEAVHVLARWLDGRRMPRGPLSLLRCAG